MRRTSVGAASIFLLALLAGCGGSDTSPAGVAPSPGDGPGPSVNARGNYLASVGEQLPLGAVNSEQGGGVGTWTITKLTPNYQCPGTGESGVPIGTPNNAAFVRLDVTAVTAPVGAGASGGEGSASGVNSAHFSFITSDGLSTPNTDMGTFAADEECIPDNEKFPSGDLGPGQRFQGAIILDVYSPTGTLIYYPEVTRQPPGWEIKVGG